MFYSLGIDLGTSGVKVLLVDENGKIIKTVSAEYPIYFPEPGWSEQNPVDWWEAVKKCILEIVGFTGGENIKAIGCAGQMHGLVILDRDDNVIRPAILWNDGRTAEQTEYLNNVIGKEKLSALTGNIAFAGFTAPKLLWLKDNEIDNFKHVSKIMLPKDYINYMLTGIHSCDYSDASGMLLLDVKNKQWSDEMLEICSVKKEQLPELYESYEVIGKIKEDIADELSISRECAVVAGAGDNAAAAVGTGTVGEGACNISIGTSGTVFISSDKFGVDENNSLHSFAHADGGYHLMGCILSAASCNKWFCDDILKNNNYKLLQSEITDNDLGTNNVFYLPYLMGERSPINDTDARSTFTGMTMDTKQKDMLLAVLEGVAFAIRDNIEAAKRIGINISRSYLCGGGSSSELWLKIFANVLNITIDIPLTQEGPGYGAAMLALVGCGRYGSVKECAEKLTLTKRSIEPNPDIASLYENKYEKFKKLYPSLKDFFKN